MDQQLDLVLEMQNFKKMFTFLSKNLDKYDFTLQPARSM